MRSLTTLDRKTEASDVVITVTVDGFARVTRASEFLVDCAFAPQINLLGVIQTLSRLDNLSHFLQWQPKHELPVFELPRLGVNFGFRPTTSINGQVEMRLASLSHSGLFVSNQRGRQFWHLVSGMPHSLLLENDAASLSVLIPSVNVYRPKIQKYPFRVQVETGRTSTFFPGA